MKELTDQDLFDTCKKLIIEMSERIARPNEMWIGLSIDPYAVIEEIDDRLKEKKITWREFF